MSDNTSAAASKARILKAGDQLGPYSLIECIGEGGMGEVWRGRDTRLDRVIAIKVLRKRFSDRFQAEARAISSLNHPNICCLYDVGCDRELDFLVLEYVVGRPLRGPLSIAMAVGHAIEIAGALQAAHLKNIVHCDLKPANILVTKSGIKLLDFGIAKVCGPVRESDATLTGPATGENSFAGTPQYMAPEQFETGLADVRTDIWGFGCVLYEMLTGESPFSGSSPVSTAAAVLSCRPKSASQLNPDIPQPLERVVEACLTRDPDDRFQTARDLRRALEWVRLGNSDKAGEQRPARHDAAVTLRAFTASGGIVEHPSFSPDGKQLVFSWNGPRSSTPNLYLKLSDVEDILRLTNGPAADLAPAWSPDGSRIAFLRDAGEGRAILMTISPLGGNQRKIGDLSISLDRVAPSLAWTPDGKYLATSDEGTGGPGLFLISAKGGEKVRLTQIAADEVNNFAICDVAPAFSPRADKLAFIRVTGSVQSRLLWTPLDANFQPREAPQEIETGFVTHMSVCWTSDGSKLLIAAGAGALGHLYLVPCGMNERPEPLLPALEATSASLHAASRKVICQSPAQTINIWEQPLTHGGNLAAEAIALTSTVRLSIRPIYSPDGNWIAFTSTRSGDPGVWLMDRQGSRIMRLPAPESAVNVASDWSPDSKSIFLFSNPSNQYDIFRIEVDSGCIQQITDHPANDWRGRCSRDGRLIYFTSSRDGHFLLWRMSSVGGQASVVTRRSASSATESPDGHWLYYAEYPAGGLYRIPIGGGVEQQILPRILDTESYAVARNGGIYYLVRSPGAHERRYSLGVPYARADLRFHDPATNRDELLARFPRPVYGGLSLSPDGLALAYAEIERDSQELLLVENFGMEA